MLTDIAQFALVVAGGPQSRRALQLLRSEQAALDETQHAVAAGIGNDRQPELVDIAPKLIVAGTIEMFCSGVRVQSVGEPVVER